MWGSDIGASLGAYKDMMRRFLDAAVMLSPAELRAVAHDTGKGCSSWTASRPERAPRYRRR